MEKKRLRRIEVRDRLKQVESWKLHGFAFQKNIVLKDFVHAMGFVQSAALLAEKFNHHPDIEIRWNKVTLTLSTHSVGGLTDIDFALAEEIDKLYHN
ncbi:MAG: 4a-hydroxytetrahydrobiopterin dehydratase [bacterium]